MKRILFIPHTYSHGGGAEKVLNTLIGELAKWYEIDIIERWEDDIFVYDLPHNVRRLKAMTYYPHIVNSMGWNKLYWILHRKILTILTVLFPRLVYTHYIKSKYDYEISFNYLYSAFLIANSPNRKSIKIMWNHTDLYDLDYRRYSGFNRYVVMIKRAVQRNAFKHADQIVAISQNTYESIVSLFPFTSSYVSIILNGYRFEDFQMKSKEFPVEKTDRFRLIFVGRLEKRKNVICAVEAINKVLESSTVNAELLILGDGECREYAEFVAKTHKGHFTFAGFKSNPYPFICSSDALILTSTNEGFPTVIIEAISLGIPVITTRVGGVEEIIQEGKNGLVVENDYKKVAEGICYMANHYDQFNNHIEETVSQFTAEKWGSRVKELIEKMRS